MIIKYIAYDGEEFNTEKECLDYEKEFNNFCIDYSNHIYCEDVNDKPIDLVHTPFNIDQAFRVYIFSEHGVKLAMKLYAYYGVSMPNQIGAFEYDGNTDTYISIDKQIPSLEILLNEYKEFGNRAMNYYENSNKVKGDNNSKLINGFAKATAHNYVQNNTIKDISNKGDNENDSTNSNT